MKTPDLKSAFILANIGRVLNRFSKDIGFMDALLPNKMLDNMTVSNKISITNKCCFFLLQFGLRVTGILVTACVANYWLSILVILIVVSALVFRNYFLCTLRNIQRLEALGNLIARLFDN